MTLPLAPGDRRRIWIALREWCAAGSVVALRTRAIAALVIVSRGFLRPAQAKGGDAGAGPFELSPRARAALRAYLRAAIKAGWIAWPAPPGTPLFLGHRGRAGAAGHGRLSKRASQWAWHAAQRRAGITEPYGFHSLRHDSATRLRAAGADVLDLQHHLRLRTTAHVMRYAHRIDASRAASELVARAARL
jgi:integrase